MFLEKVMLVIKYLDRFGFFGLKFLFMTLYGKQKLLKLKYKTFIHPIYIRNKTSDVPTFTQCIIDESYNLNLGIEPNTIIDLGSNIGLSAVFFATRYPNAKIVCVEPELQNFDLLCMNTFNFKNVKGIQKGVWHRNAKLKVIDTAGSNWGFTVEETDSNDGINAITINEIMSQENIETIDVLKIDIEGAEKYLFNENYESWLSKVKVIIIELHDKSMPGCSKSFFNALAGYDFAIRTSGESVVCYLDTLNRPFTKRVKVF
jgi:FkbM family methyltransferase